MYTLTLKIAISDLAYLLQKLVPFWQSINFVSVGACVLINSKVGVST